MSVISSIVYHIYRLPLMTVFVLMGIAVLVWAILAVTLRKKYRKSWKAVNTVFLLLLVYSILYITLLRRKPNPDNLMVLTPFASLEAAKQQGEIYRELTMNILLFFPVGLFLPQLLPDRWKTWQKILVTAAAGLLFSAGMETVQFLTALGDAETDDILTNVLGTAFGALHVLLAGGIYRLLKKKCF